jgi:hypothetical protein
LYKERKFVHLFLRIRGKSVKTKESKSTSAKVGSASRSRIGIFLEKQLPMRLSRVGKNQCYFNEMDNFVADRNSLRQHARKEGSMLYEPPMPDKMTGVEDDYAMIYQCTEALNAAFQEALRTTPDRTDEEIRADLAPRFNFLAQSHWTIWIKFTDREKDEETRRRMLLTIMVAQRVRSGELDPEQAKATLSDLMGVDESKRHEIRNNLA